MVLHRPVELARVIGNFDAYGNCSFRKGDFRGTSRTGNLASSQNPPVDVGVSHYLSIVFRERATFDECLDRSLKLKSEC
jgi:hypothetical protein